MNKSMPILLTGLLLFAGCGGGGGASSSSAALDAPADTSDGTATTPDVSDPPVGGGTSDTPPPEAPSEAEPPPDESPMDDLPVAEPDPEPPLESPAVDSNYAPFAYDETSFDITLYVDSSAANNGDGSSGAPFNSLKTAIDRATAGTQILVSEGQYAAIGWHDQLQGTPSKPILIKAQGLVIVDAGGSGLGGQFVQPEYLIIDGLTIQNTARHGLSIDDGNSASTPANHLILKNLHFRLIGNGTNSDCLKLSGVQMSLVSGSEFQDCNRGEGIDFVGGHNVNVISNHFHDVVGTGLQIKGGSSDILVKNNLFENVPGRSINAGGNTDIPLFRPVGANAEASNIQMETNVFVDSGNTPVSFTGCVDCQFVNNTILRPRSYIARILFENESKAETQNIRYQNNLILFNRNELNAGSFLNISSNTNPLSVQFRNNFFFALDDPSFNVVPFSNRVPAPVDSTIQQPHGLVGWQTGNYRPNSDSAAIGVGLMDQFAPLNDADGRAFSNPPTVGAYAAPE